MEDNTNKTLSNNLIAGSFALIVVSLWSTVPVADRLSGGKFCLGMILLISGLVCQVLSIICGGQSISGDGKKYNRQAIYGIFGIVLLAMPPLLIAFAGEKSGKDFNQIVLDRLIDLENENENLKKTMLALEGKVTSSNDEILLGLELNRELINEHSVKPHPE